MERDKTQYGESRSTEDMYFEMDFTPSIHGFNSDDELDDLSSLSDPADQTPVIPTDALQANLSATCSIPIHGSCSTLSDKSYPNTPSTWESPLSVSEQRTISSSCSMSQSLTSTPVSSVSPSSSFIPRILRSSFSKLLNRNSLPSRAKTQEREQPYSDCECENCDDTKDSETTTISPATQEIVEESLQHGLPIIPFAYPTFFTASKNQEDVKRQIRKNSIKSMRKSFSRGKCLDYSEVTEEDDESCSNDLPSDDKSLETIVKIAQQEIEDSTQDIPPLILSRQASHSSYVEMNPGEASPNPATMVISDDPYMKMEDFLDNSYPPLKPNNKLKDGSQSNSVSLSCENALKNTPKRKTNLLQAEKDKRQVMIREGMTRQYKKGNKHKDDYVFFDFEQNRDYVDMDKAKTKKWQFLDFKRK